MLLLWHWCKGGLSDSQAINQKGGRVISEINCCSKKKGGGGG